LASHPLYYFRPNVALVFGGLFPFGEVLTDYRFFVDFDKIIEPNIKIVFSCYGANSAGEGEINFRIGGTINVLNGSIVFTHSIFGGFPGIPQTFVAIIPNIYSGILPVKLTGRSVGTSISQAMVLGSATFVISGAP
jgi:hypothetical protein